MDIPTLTVTDLLRNALKQKHKAKAIYYICRRKFHDEQQHSLLQQLMTEECHPLVSFTDNAHKICSSYLFTASADLYELYRFPIGWHRMLTCSLFVQPSSNALLFLKECIENFINSAFCAKKRWCARVFSHVTQDELIAIHQVNDGRPSPLEVALINQSIHGGRHHVIKYLYRHGITMSKVVTQLREGCFEIVDSLIQWGHTEDIRHLAEHVSTFRLFLQTPSQSFLIWNVVCRVTSSSQKCQEWIDLFQSFALPILHYRVNELMQAAADNNNHTMVKFLLNHEDCKEVSWEVAVRAPMQSQTWTALEEGGVELHFSIGEMYVNFHQLWHHHHRSDTKQLLKKWREHTVHQLRRVAQTDHFVKTEMFLHTASSDSLVECWIQSCHKSGWVIPAFFYFPHQELRCHAPILQFLSPLNETVLRGFIQYHHMDINASANGSSNWLSSVLKLAVSTSSQRLRRTIMPIAYAMIHEEGAVLLEASDNVAIHPLFLHLVREKGIDLVHDLDIDAHFYDPIDTYFCKMFFK